MNYEFICPNCGNDVIEEVQYGINRYAYVTVENYGSGPEFYEDENDVKYSDTMSSKTIWRCSECRWELPCSTPEEVVEWIEEKEEERLI